MDKYGKIYRTKIGNLAIYSNSNFITNICFNANKINSAEEKETKIIKQTFKEIKEYMEGKRKTFTIPIKPEGTDFQKKVWKALQSIPYGKICSYKDIAQKISCPNGCRAIGLANSKNPIPIIIPCHRVINANGKIGGFSGGLPIKIKLLEIEKLSKNF